MIYSLKKKYKAVFLFLVLDWKKDEIFFLYQQEMFRHGILCFSGVMMLSYSHSKEDLDLLISAFDEACKVIKLATESKKPFTNFLEGVPGAPGRCGHHYNGRPENKRKHTPPATDSSHLPLER